MSNQQEIDDTDAILANADQLVTSMDNSMVQFTARTSEIMKHIMATTKKLDNIEAKTEIAVKQGAETNSRVVELQNQVSTMTQEIKEMKHMCAAILSASVASAAPVAAPAAVPVAVPAEYAKTESTRYEVYSYVVSAPHNQRARYTEIAKSLLTGVFNERLSNTMRLLSIAGVLVEMRFAGKTGEEIIKIYDISVSAKNEKKHTGVLNSLQLLVYHNRNVLKDTHRVGFNKLLESMETDVKRVSSVQNNMKPNNISYAFNALLRKLDTRAYFPLLGMCAIVYYNGKNHYNDLHNCIAKAVVAEQMDTLMTDAFMYYVDYALRNHGRPLRYTPSSFISETLAHRFAPI
jgi:hypothetical protein